MDNYENFLSPEDNFRLAMETYIPEFMKRMENDTMQDNDFIQYTIEMMELAKSVGVDLQQYILDYGKANGLE